MSEQFGPVIAVMSVDEYEQLLVEIEPWIDALRVSPVASHYALANGWTPEMMALGSVLREMLYAIRNGIVEVSPATGGNPNDN